MGVAYKCSSDGTSIITKDCEAGGGKCVGGSCVTNECLKYSPGDRWCSGGTAMKCNDNWTLTTKDCEAGGGVCVGGSCVTPTNTPKPAATTTRSL